jgi:hypothetical protein
MICSSVKRLLRIVDLLAIDSTISWREFRGASQMTSSNTYDPGAGSSDDLKGLENPIGRGFRDCRRSDKGPA